LNVFSFIENNIQLLLLLLLLLLQLSSISSLLRSVMRVENQILLKYITLQEINSRNLLRYIDLFHDKVKEKVRNIFLHKFHNIFDNNSLILTFYSSV